MEDFILLFTFLLHLFLDALFGVLELPPDIMVGHILVIMDVSAGSPCPNKEHGQGPDKEKYQDDACTYEELVGHIVTRQIADVGREGLHREVIIGWFVWKLLFL